MKGTFDIATHITKMNTYLPINFVEDKTKTKAGYAVLALSSTGLNSQLVRIHDPIRITIQEFVYDSAQNKYVEGGCFDRFIKCSKQALDAARKNKDEYDIFAKGGIDEEAYIRGDNVYPPNVVKKDLIAYLSNLDPSIQYMIGNNMPYIREFLNKININIQEYNDGANIVSRYLTKGKEIPLLNQTSLTYFYFNKYAPNKERANSLEGLMTYLSKDRGKEEIIQALEAKYKGTELRVRYISEFINEIGESVGALEKSVNRLKEIIDVEKYESKEDEELISEKTENENQVHEAEEEIPAETSDAPQEVSEDNTSDEQLREEPSVTESLDAQPDKTEEETKEEPVVSKEDPEAAQKEVLEQTSTETEELEPDRPVLKEARNMPANMTVPETSPDPIYKFYIDSLVNNEEIDPEKINDKNSDSDFVKLCNLKKNAKGFTIMKVLTSHEDVQKVPIMVCLLNMAYKDDGSYEKKGLIKLVNISNNEIIDSEEQDYDTFEKNGLNADDFRTGNKTVSKEVLAAGISKFFQIYPISDYPLISDNRQNSGHSQSQIALINIGNLPEFTAPYIDINKAFTEYLYLTLHDEKYKKNVILKNPLAYAEDDVNVRAISENFERPCRTITDEAQFAAFLIHNIEKQQALIFPEEYRKEEPESDRRMRPGMRDRGSMRRSPDEFGRRPDERRGDRPYPRRMDNDSERRFSTFDSERERRRAPDEDRFPAPRRRNPAEEEQPARKEELSATESFDRLMGRKDDEPVSPIRRETPEREPVIEEKTIEPPKLSPEPEKESEPSSDEGKVPEEKEDSPSVSTPSASITIPETDNMNDAEFRKAIIDVVGVALQTIAQQNQIINNMQKNQDSFVNVLNHWMTFVIEDKQRNFSPIELLHRAQGEKDGDDINERAVKNIQSMKEELMIISEASNNTQLQSALEQATANLEKSQEILHSLKNNEREEQRQKDGE